MPPENIPELLYNGRADDYRDYLADPHDVDAVVQGYTEASTFARLAWNPRHDCKLPRRLGGIGCAALVVEPDEDRVVPRQHFDRWVELLGDARLARVCGPDAEHPTGHLLIVQEPDQAAALITRFIQEQEAAA